MPGAITDERQNIASAMVAPQLTSGLKAIMQMDKEIDTDEHQDAHQQTKVVKLRFTRKQYEAFRDACTIMGIVSSDPKFTDYVKSVLGDDVKVPTISKQFVQPIVDAPTRIPLKLPRAAKASDQKRESYFTAPTRATDECMLLYAEVEEDGVDLKQNIKEGITCITDVRVMMSRYIALNDLRNEDGILVDEFIYKLAPGALNNNSDQIHRIGGKHVIPKGNRKVMTDIVNEVTFGK